MFRIPLTVAAATALAVSLAPVAAADTLGVHCSDWMKISADATTGAKMFCAAPPGTGDYALTWTAWSRGAWGNAPAVGPVGSPCSAPNYTFGLSSDGYVVWCYAGGKVLCPAVMGTSPPPRRRSGACTRHNGTGVTFFEVAMNKAFRALVDDRTEVSVEIGLRAAEKLQSVLDGGERDTEVLELKVALYQTRQAVRAVVPESMWGAIIAKLEELEQDQEALDVDTDSFDDAEHDSYDPTEFIDDDDDEF